MKDKYQCVLSNEADQDLDAIYIEGFYKWGEKQADQYFDSLLKHFQLLSENPYLFRSVDEIKAGYRRSVCGKHAIYYRIVDKTVEIMALVKYENRP
uniref:type II toxin-antitoxin system RelE/ParE family toxin n=1 Tax=Ningiella ruwaisensis TaxID=2364274 RepID=UPI0010A0785B|nr:type II toxin-antitoxin system RelE/ParE family toxin [Ningiella ruwaisensis]